MSIAELFSIIPERFFSVLASPLRELYAGVLFQLYEQYLLSNFGIPREVALDLTVDYLEGEGTRKAWLGELEDASWEEGADQDSRSRAGFILRKLTDCGWLITEIYHDYNEYVNLADYAIQVLETLDRVRRQHQIEYQGYVYSTYTLLYSPEADKNGYLALEKAQEQTAQLMSGLKSLNHNIKRHIDQVLKEKSPQEILRLHFEDYRRTILDQSYHRLKTSDNVSRYRPKIVDRINKWSRDKQWLQQTVKMELKRENYSSDSEALAGIHRSLDFVAASYYNMDTLLEEIDRRNSQYAGASYTTLRFALSHSRNLEGQVLEILKYLAGLRTAGEQRADDLLPQDVSPLFSLFSQQFLDAESLYTPRSLGRQHDPAEIIALAEPDRGRQEERLARAREVLVNKLTRDKINDFVRERLGQRTSARASELGIEEVEDLVKLIYAAAFSCSAGADYTVDFTAAPYFADEQERFRFRDVTIKQKGKVT